QHPLFVELLQARGDGVGLARRDVPPDGHHREGGAQSAGAKRGGQRREVAVRRQVEGVHQAPSVWKNSAPRTSTVGITSARSRKSLCCSHDVSAISRQP